MTCMRVLYDNKFYLTHYKTMANRESRLENLLGELKQAVSQTTSRTDDGKDTEPIILPHESCPPGTAKCNPLEEECPLDGVRPNIFTKSGIMCSPPKLIKEHRDSINPADLKTKLRELVREANRLVLIDSKVAGILEAKGGLRQNKPPKEDLTPSMSERAFDAIGSALGVTPDFE